MLTQNLQSSPAENHSKSSVNNIDDKNIESDSSTTVNTIDARIFDEISFVTLPSTRVNPANLRPLSVFDKKKEVDDIIAAANVLCDTHRAYESTFIAGGRKALYKILAEIYCLALQVNSSDYCDSILKELRVQLALKRVKTQKNSNAITMIVRWVVGGSRQVAHMYSKALQAAFEDNISSAELSDYFTKIGGLQKVKSRGQAVVTNKKAELYNEFNLFMRGADVNYKAYQNTKIRWTEEVLGNSSSTKMMIVGESNGGDQMIGYRAFRVSTHAYDKISKILAEDVFKNQTIDEVKRFVQNESDIAFKKSRAVTV